MTKQQQIVLAIVAALSIFIGVGITLLITSGDDDQGPIGIGTTTSSLALPTSTLAPITAPPTLPPTTQGTTATTDPITPGTKLVVPPSTTATTKPAPTTTKPALTTTQPAPTTTQSPPTTTTQPDRNTDVGITENAITLAVIADDAETFQGMQAWQSAVNRRGGIAERKIKLDLLETGGTAEGYANAVTSACDRDFAIVGSFSRFDTSAESAGCALIPDLPVQPIASDHSTASNTFAAFPRQEGIEAVGSHAWLLANVAGCCNQFVLVPDADPERTHTLASIDAGVTAGFTTAGSVDVSASDDAIRYAEILDEMEAAGVTFATSGLGRDSTVLLRTTAAGRAPDVTAWYCDANCYDNAFLADGGDAVDGQYVAIETAPFSDRSEIGALRTYLRITKRLDHEASYAGLRAFATGMLWEAATKQVVDDQGDNGLTRTRLLEALATIHDFTAGGIAGPTDVATGTPNGCYALLRVVDGAFERANPTDKGALDCGSQNLVELP
ncbi:MAG: hypothetical protein EXQ79_07730 [Acidimicrobiia bacterium]|nr:hypothetical protein [Acidimicrobiia bacterium]